MATEEGTAASVVAVPTQEIVMPTGVEVRYYDGKQKGVKRHYEVRQVIATDEPPVPGGIQEELSTWREAISVTTALKIVNKEGLSWWGMRIGGGAVVRLIDMGICSFDRATGRLAIQVAGTWRFADEELIYAAIKEHKLSVKDELEDAGERGTGVHDALEAWAAVGVMPEPATSKHDERMYVEALRKFCEDVGDNWHTDGIETQVASVQHLFAGRYDVRGRFTGDVELVVDALTKDYEPRKRGARKQVFEGGTRVLADAKTSKGVYTTHFMQLEGYEGAGTQECGIEETDIRAVLHLTKHGLYEFVVSPAGYDDFLSALDLHRRNERIAKEANL